MRYFKIMAVVLFFVLAGLIFTHSFSAIHQDIGRHIALGKIIWQTHQIPNTNLFSFTEPEQPFVNHHWLSEVIFYLVDRAGGIESIIVFKVIVLILTYLVLYYAVPRRSQFLWVTLALISLFIFIDRTEARPEIFSYLFFALFFLILYRVRDGRWTDRWLWLLVPIELLWVNSHIYFIIGIGLYGVFYIDRLVAQKATKQQLFTGLALGLITLVNPAGLQGALYPLTVFRDYGFPVVENKSIAALIRHTNRWPFNLKVFIVSLFVLFGVFIARIRSPKRYIFEIITSIFFVYGAFTMLRNVSIYALGFLPITYTMVPDFRVSKHVGRLGIGILFSALIFLIVIIPTNILYGYLDVSRRFGLGVPESAKSAVEFVKTNNIQGNVFNDFDIGSYLVWRLYPEQKVFCDGRPEAYSYSFWQDIYIPMQSDYEVWKKLYPKYGINYIFFNHTDNSPWTSTFLQRISRDPEWAMVYLNDIAVIYLHRVPQNSSIINKYEINTKNILQNLDSTMAGFSIKNDTPYRDLGRFLYKIGEIIPSGYVYDRLTVVMPQNAYAYQGKAYALSGLDTQEGYQRAAVAMRKAIDLGLGSADDYFLLALSQAKIGDRNDAIKNLDIVLKKNPQNADALRLKSILVRK